MIVRNFNIMKFFLLLILLLSLGFYLIAPNIPYIASNFSSQSPLPLDDLSGNYNYLEQLGEWEGSRITTFPYRSRMDLATRNVLSLVSFSNKRIEIDLTHQKLYAFEGENKVFEFPISSGLYNWTPTGEFWVWIKLRYTLMTGGNKALHTYYYLPNVPFTMYFENDNVSRTKGYGIHGAYWHNDFGRPKSHGCVNLRPEDAEKLYYWTEPNLNGKNSIRTTEDNPGTRIIIYGQYQG